MILKPTWYIPTLESHRIFISPSIWGTPTRKISSVRIFTLFRDRKERVESFSTARVKSIWNRCSGIFIYPLVFPPLSCVFAPNPIRYSTSECGRDDEIFPIFFYTHTRTRTFPDFFPVKRNENVRAQGGKKTKWRWIKLRSNGVLKRRTLRGSLSFDRFSARIAQINIRFPSEKLLLLSLAIPLDVNVAVVRGVDIHILIRGRKIRRRKAGKRGNLSREKLLKYYAWKRSRFMLGEMYADEIGFLVRKNRFRIFDLADVSVHKRMILIKLLCEYCF